MFSLFDPISSSFSALMNAAYGQGTVKQITLWEAGLAFASDLADLSLTYLMPIFASMQIIVMLYKNLGEGDVDNDYKNLWQWLVSFVLIWSFTEWLPVFKSLISLIEESMGDTDYKDVIQAFIQEGRKNISQGTEKMWDDGHYLQWAWTQYSKNKEAATDMMTLTAAQGWFATIRIIVEKFQVIALGVITGFGPFAFAFQNIPGKEGLGKKWFNNWFGVACWSITLKGVDMMVVLYSKMYAQNYLQADTDFTIDCIIMCIMYILIPLLTSWYAGQSGAGSIMSKVVGMATMAAMAGGKIASMAASGGASAAAGAKGAGGLAGPAQFVMDSVKNSFSSGETVSFSQVAGSKPNNNVSTK